MKKNRHWYQALEEDYDLDLLELWKINKLGITDKSLKSYKAGGKPTQEKKIEAILTLIQIKRPLFKKETLDQYLKGEYPERSEMLPANCHYLFNTLEKFDNQSSLMTILNSEFETSDSQEIAEQTESIISQAEGEGTGRVMKKYGNAINAEVDATSNPEDLDKLENLVGALALMATNASPKEGMDKVVTIMMDSNKQDWTIQLMLDNEKVYKVNADIVSQTTSVMERVTVKEEGLLKLGAPNCVPLGIEQNGDAEYLELHECINLIAKKYYKDPKYQCPDLTPDDGNKAFNQFCKELVGKLSARKDNEDYIFATMSDKMSEKTIEKLENYLAEGKASELAMDIFKLSSNEGHEPYRLKSGHFSAWIIDRLNKIAKKSESIKGEASQSSDTNETEHETKNEGEKDMNQSNSTGDFSFGNVGTVNMFSQDKRAIIINHKDALSELKQQITGQSDAEQGLRDSIQAAANEEPKEENAEDQKSRWQRIKNGINTLENSAKMMVTFDKAYAAVTKVAPWLAGVS